MDQYDVIVVGGGTSGMMAAIQAAEQSGRILLLEKNPSLGRKLLLTGGGRCNVTNRAGREDLIRHLPGNGRFLYGALHQFAPEAIIDFFQERDVQLKEEDHGRMFPATDKAMTILQALQTSLEDLGVEIRYRNPVKSLLYEGSGRVQRVVGVVSQDGTPDYGRTVILALGGQSYPGTGSTGDGYALAQSVGHSIEALYPTEVPLLSSDPWIKDQSLKGLALRQVKVSVWGEAGGSRKKPLVSHQMDMIFTHFGYSGPAILRCSGHVNQYLRVAGRKTCLLSVDLVPDLEAVSWQEEWEAQRDRQVLSFLKQWMPSRMADCLLHQAGIESQALVRQIDHGSMDKLWQLVKAFPLTVTGSLPLDKAFVTGGGVCLKEVDPKTMASKLCQGLYFCGELLDINGYTGGYNITAAFVTAAVAGRQAAWAAWE